MPRVNAHGSNNLLAFFASELRRKSHGDKCPGSQARAASHFLDPWYNYLIAPSGIYTQSSGWQDSLLAATL